MSFFSWPVEEIFWHKNSKFHANIITGSKVMKVLIKSLNNASEQRKKCMKLLKNSQKRPNECFSRISLARSQPAWLSRLGGNAGKVLDPQAQAPKQGRTQGGAGSHLGLSAVGANRQSRPCFQEETQGLCQCGRWPLWTSTSVIVLLRHKSTLFRATKIIQRESRRD